MPDGAGTAARVDMKHWRIAMLAAAAVLVAIVVITFAVFKPMVTDMVIQKAEAMGFKDVKLDIDRLGPTSLHIASLTFGPGRALGAKDITLDYSPLRLLSGHLDEVRIGDIFVAASLRSGEPMFPFLEGFHGSGGDIVLPVDKVQIEKSSLNIVSPAGDYELAFSGKIESARESGFTTDGMFKLTGAAGEADGTVTGRMNGAGAFDGSAQVAAVTFMTPAMTVASGQAEITARGSLYGLDEANAQFALLNSRLGGISIDTLDGEANYKPGATRVDLTLNSGNPKLSGTASLRINEDDTGAPAQVGLDARLRAAGFAGLNGVIGQAAEASGDARLQVSGVVSDFAALSNDLQNHAIPGSVRLQGDLVLKSGRLHMPDADIDATADGGLDIAVADGQLTIGSEEGLTFSLANRGSLHLTESSAKARKPLAVLGPNFQPGTMQVVAALSLDTRRFGDATGTLEGTVNLGGADGSFVQAAPLTLQLEGRKPVALGDMTISKLTVGSTITGGFGRIEGDTTTSFDLDSAGKTTPRIQGGKVHLEARIGARADGEYAVVDKCARLTLNSLDAGPVTAAANALSLCPAGANAPLADIRYSAANGVSLALAGALRTGDVALKVARKDADPLNLELGLSPVSVKANKASSDAALAVQLSMSGGKIDFTDYLARIQNAGFDVSLVQSKKRWKAAVQSLKGQLVDRRQVALFTPLNISVQGSLDPAAGKATARVSDPSGSFVVTGSATYDPEKDRGSASFR
ncbi:MAG TPA: hypothetical protein VKA19_14820, partial [Alphaproteobacteria bacterium]|nr:hypothetical protein [Alphaproteobacteria bacterium]